MRKLECSSKGDTRYSAFYARVTIFGIEDSIENHYQLSKRFGDEDAPLNWRQAKGKHATHMHLNGDDYAVEHLTAFYKLLWCRYLDNNPELVTYAQQFDKFTDRFKGNSINCQADVIEQYVRNRESLVKETLKFNRLVRSNT